MTTAAEVAGALIPVIRTSSKPVVIALMGEDLIAPAARPLRQSPTPDYRFPERAASALSVLVRRAEQLAQPQDEPGGIAGVRPDLPEEASAHAQGGADGFAESDTAAWVASAYGLLVSAAR